MKRKFVHLHVHSEYSLLDGLSKTKELISYVKENGMEALAITDHGAMYGAIEFYKNVEKAEIKPIIGMEAYITNVDRKLRGERSKIKNFHLLLLAKNNEGYKNLMKLSSVGHLEGYYYRPRIDHEILKKHAKGIIATSGCPQGEIPQALIEGDYTLAKKLTDQYVDVFGDDFYFEMQRHHMDMHAKNAPSEEIAQDLRNMSNSEKKINEGVLKLSREYGLPIIATNDAHYIRKEDASAQDALVCIATGKNVDETKRLRFIDTPDFYIKTPEEMYEEFSDLPEACENTVKLAEKCSIEITLGKYFFPKTDLPEGVTPEDELRRLTDEGLKEKYGKVTEELRKRADYELEVIISKEYAAYFLIYRHMAMWARDQRIPINTRGSAAGSLVSYSLGITTVDPMRYGLPFERFLNPFRPSAPDIDMDIADDMREEMIKHLTEKFGKEKVAQICTFGRMLAKGSVRDVARVLGYPYETGDRISKMIPEGSQGFAMTINRALDESSELRDLYNTDSTAKRIIDLAKQIEGNARHISVHAAGVVIAPTELTDFIPLQREPSGEKVITQYEMHACEDVGLVKLDILGIRNLSILREAVRLVLVIEEKEIDIMNVPVDDSKTFEMLARGETMGVFQLSSGGMTKHLVELQPARIEDIMQMVALYRPGPMAFIPEYIKRKHNPKLVKYMDPRMEEFLEESYGILVYQDDVIYCALNLAGYDWGEADKFRKAIGKKIPEEMDKQKDKFINGCVERGMNKKTTLELWSQIETFAAYGFNKAHAASYGMVAYWTAYMKANYPAEYMTALLTAEAADKDKISQAVNECRRMGIKVLPPDINESRVEFSISKDADSLGGKAIRFGLDAIKHVGAAAIASILEAREEGDFKSFSDFVSRVDNRKVNKKVVESLIKVGALSKFGNRASLLESMDEVRSKAKSGQSGAQQDLFSVMPSSGIDEQALHRVYVDLPELGDDELTNLEKQLLGFSLSAKPVGELIGDIIGFRSHKIGDLTEESMNDRGEIKIACIVSEVRVVTTRRTGAEMAFAKVVDESGMVDCVVFPKLYSSSKLLWEEGMKLVLVGKLDQSEEGVSLLINEALSTDQLKQMDRRVAINIPEDTSREKLIELKKLLVENPGKDNVKLIFEGKGKEIDLAMGINWSREFAEIVASLFSEKE